MRKCLYLTLVFFIASSVLNQACGEKIQVRTVDGVKVIENPKEPAPPKGALMKLSLKEEFCLGQGGADEEMVSYITGGLDVDSEGNIYILDIKEKKVKIFDRTGKFLKKFGIEGQDPRDINMPFTLQITSNNELVVDGADPRLTFYSLEGEFLRALYVAKVLGLSQPVIDSQGNIVGISHKIINPGSGETRILQEARKYDGKFNLLFTITSIDISNFSQGKFNPFQCNISYQLGKDDSIFFLNPDEYEIKVLNSEGKLVKRILKDYDPVKVTEKDKEEFFELLPGWPPRDSIEFPKEFPAYRNFTLDEQGRLFVMTCERGKKKGEYFIDVFDPEGQYIAKIPFKGEPLVWKAQRLYADDVDEDGFQVLRVFSVRWEK